MSLLIKSSHRGMAGRVSAGDPGIFGFLGRAAKTALKFIPGGDVISSFMPGPGRGNVVGQVGYAPGPLTFGTGSRLDLSSTIARTLAATSGLDCGLGQERDSAGNCVSSATLSGGIRTDLARAFPGGSTGIRAAPESMNGGKPSGYHANKSSYWLMDGTFIEKGTRWVKNRRRNPANARALSRAIGRIDLGKKLQGTLAGISTGKYTAAGKRKACKTC